ncbi:MAG: hypothetical protein V1875_05195 [Candidatus Altiarchaeota archaeon]
MRILKEADSENCFDGGLIMEYLLDCPVTEGFVKYLRAFGEVTVLDDIRKPFFTLDKEYFFSIKGIIGESSIRVIYRPKNSGRKEEFLKSMIGHYPQKNGHIPKELRDLETAMGEEAKSSR